jgi:hypothetical protein
VRTGVVSPLAIKHMAKYPAIRGGFIWESYIEGRTSYQWTRLTGQAIASS